VRAFSVPRIVSTIEERREDQSCLFRRGDYRNEGQNPENLYCARVLVKNVYVARKLITAEKRRQDESSLFWRVDYRNKGQHPEKLSWIRVPVKMVSVDRKLGAVEERRQVQSCLSRLGCYREKRPQLQKFVLSSSPGEYELFSSGTRHDIKNRTKSKAERLQEKKKATTSKKCPGF
jgi:hypothetical protein